jgi:cyclic pyranopterin phosphate synthase
MDASFSHLDSQGNLSMVDVGSKPPTERVAVAEAVVELAPATMQLLRQAALPKGDVLTCAKVGGIMAAKRVGELIPLCHPLNLTYADVRFEVTDEPPRVRIETETRTVGPTGVEMEALVAAQTAAAGIYDMCQAVQRDIVISRVRLLHKSGPERPLRRAGAAVSMPVVDPVALTLGHLQVRWYGLMYLAGFALGWILGRYRATRPGSGWTAADVDDLLTCVMVGIILGAVWAMCCFTICLCTLAIRWKSCASGTGVCPSTAGCWAYWGPSGTMARSRGRSFLEVSDFILHRSSRRGSFSAAGQLHQRRALGQGQRRALGYGLSRCGPLAPASLAAV